MRAESFSGTHPYQVSCAKLQIELDWCDTFAGPRLAIIADKFSDRITEAVNNGDCPRCGDDLPTGGMLPAGSRTTACRCIPVFSECGTDEAYQVHRFGGYSRLDQWPVAKSGITRRRNIMMAGATITTAVLNGSTLITEDGATEMQMRPHPGGWAEYGHDTTEDTM